jgi:large subunit ribosomal protein L23
MKEPRLIVKRALLSEKGAHQRDVSNQYIFEVAIDANKIEIKKAVETIFDVNVTEVRTMIRRGKPKRFGRYEGMRATWKRAIVTLKDGDEINLVDQV